MANPLILASQSTARRDMLQNAGVEVACVPARIDEAAIKAALLAQNAKPIDLADALADLKARRVSGKFPDRVVLGADQILVHDGSVFDKPDSVAEARKQLKTLRNSAHTLNSAVVIYDRGTPVWRTIGKAELVMRDVSDAFLEHYIATLGDDLFTTVGGYKLESLGSQLFLSVKGDYFTVLGLPLLDVLAFLRGYGICQK